VEPTPTFPLCNLLPEFNVKDLRRTEIRAAAAVLPRPSEAVHSAFLGTDAVGRRVKQSGIRARKSPCGTLGSRAVKFIEVSPLHPSVTCAFVAGGSLQLLATSILLPGPDAFRTVNNHETLRREFLQCAHRNVNLGFSVVIMRRQPHGGLRALGVHVEYGILAQCRAHVDRFFT
jgi:hypothetical protein